VQSKSSALRIASRSTKRVVLRQRLVDLGKARQDGCVGGELLAQPNERPDHVHAHAYRLLAAQDVRGR